MADIEYRGTHLKTLPDGATGTQGDPVTVVRGLAIGQPDGTFVEVSNENPVPVSLAAVPMGTPVTTTIAPGESIELIPAPTDLTQQIHLHGIFLTFTPNYVLGTEVFEASIYAFKTGQPEILKFPLLGTETFDGFPSPVEIEAGYSLRLKVPNTVNLTSIQIYCGLQYRYGYPEESGSGGAISGTFQADLETRLLTIEVDISSLTDRVDGVEAAIVDLENVDTTLVDAVSAHTSAINVGLSRRIRGEVTPSLDTDTVYYTSAIAPVDKTIRVDLAFYNYGASNTNMRIEVRQSDGTTVLSQKYTKSVSAGNSETTFAGFHLSNGQALGIEASSSNLLVCSILSTEVEYGTTFLFYLSSTIPEIVNIATTKYQRFLITLFNRVSASSSYTIEILDAEDNLITSLGSKVLSGRSSAYLAFALAGNRKLRLSGSATDEILVSCYIVELDQW